MRRFGLAHAVGLLLLGFVLLQASVLVFVAIAIAGRGCDYATALRMVQTDPLPLGAAQLAALSAVTALGMWIDTPGQTPAAMLGLAPARATVLGVAAIAGLALQLPMVELTTAVTHLLPMIALPPELEAHVTILTQISSPLRAFTVPFTFVIIAPLTEELLFRGLILRNLRARYGTTRAIVASALLFGAFHGYAQALLFATIIGLVLGALAVRAGSTMPGIALHAGFNALPVLVPEELVPIPGFNTSSASDVPWPFWIGSLVIATIALGAIATMLRRTDQTS